MAGANSVSPWATHFTSPMAPQNLYIKLFLLFFFFRKISPELTSAANPPLFAEEDWP